MERIRELLVNKMGTDNEGTRAILAEFIGTFFFLLIGISANIQQAMTVASETTAQLAWGFGFAFAVYSAYTVSGGHLNPATSLSSVVTGDLHPARFALYVFAQLLGAFVGAAAAYLGHMDDINFIGNGGQTVLGRNSTAGLFTTFPSAHITMIGSFIDQVVGTAILAFCLALITDKRHQIPTGAVGLLAGLVLSMISMTFGSNGGFPVNPARDLGPRLFLLCVGYDWTLFTARDYYFWIPIVGPLVGALIGTWIYKLFVGIHGGVSEEFDTTTGKVYPLDSRGYKNGGHTIAVNHGVLNSQNTYTRPPPVPISPVPNIPTRHQGSESREPTPISWRATVPSFPDDGKLRLTSATVVERLDQLPATSFGTSEPKAEVYASFRRQPQPSPPPPIPTSPPPPLSSSVTRPSFETDRLQRSSVDQKENLNRTQEEQSLTYFTDPEAAPTPPPKSNGPTRRPSEFFAELFTPQPARRRLPTENPEITVSMAYYQNKETDRPRDPNYSYLKY